MSRRSTSLCSVVVVVGVLACACIARASDAGRRGDDLSAAGGKADGEPDVALPTVIAVVPGAVVHGAGSWAQGNRATGYRLLAMEGAGIGLVLLGGSALALTGANRYIVGPAAATVVAGFGLFTTSFFADLCEVTGPGHGWGAPRLELPAFEAELGYRYVDDPTFPFKHFTVTGLSAWLGAVRLRSDLWVSAHEPNSRWRVLAARRFTGPTPDRRYLARDGSALDVEAGVTHHRFAPQGFHKTTVEVAARGRLDWVRFDRELAGSFSDFGLGYALQTTAYDIPRARPADDHDDLLLARFSFGVYFGHGAEQNGETQIYYDHRHDDFAAGLKMSGLGSGPAGHFGWRMQYFFSESWGWAAEAEIGSAWLLGLSLRFRNEAP